MDYELLTSLRRHHPAWRLLAADNAPFVIGFLYDCFIRPNVRALSEDELTSKLDDYLYQLRERLGDEARRAARGTTCTTGPITPMAGCAATTRRARTSRTSM